MRIETERKMKRWREQRWILDQVIQTRGIDWDQGRTGKILRNCSNSLGKMFAAIVLRSPTISLPEKKLRGVFRANVETKLT